MLFRQFVDGDLGCASYLIGDPAAGEALVVDPAYAIEPYLEAAAEAGMRIVRVLETHTHADHVSGHGRLALEHGVPVAIHPAAEPEYPFEPLADGRELRVGSVTIRVVHTPGHRPEHCAFLVGGGDSTEPPESGGGGSAGAAAGHAELVLTGDSLFVGDAARPDLAVAAREGAEGLFHSLRRLTELPDPVAVYPGHVAGSLCGGSMSSEPSSTIGSERRSNPMLAIADVRLFVETSAAISAPRPPTVERCVALNRGPFLGAPRPLERHAEPGEATVLDVRPFADFAAGHLPGALSVPVSGSSFATKAAFLLDPAEEVVLHASSEEEAERAARGLRAAGLVEMPAGYLLQPTGAVARLAPVAAGELERLAAAGEVDVLDVREPDEFATGHVPEARNVPYRLLRRERDGLGARPIVTICESGPRAAVAASVLASAGLDARPVASGGMNEWRGPVERGA